MKRWWHAVIPVALLTSFAPIHAATVEGRIAQYGRTVDARLAPLFAAKKVSYPPATVTLVGLKQERVLEVYATGGKTNPVLVTSYPILAASGKLGPKLREGDLQVPEGIYPVELLNPNSLFHLSLRVGYPNNFDRQQARAEGRKNLGGDIMIHGGAASIGCVAVGDEAAEDLFVLAARTGLKNVTVILSPVDFRVRKLPPQAQGLPPWTKKLYHEIATQLRCFRGEE